MILAGRPAKILLIDTNVYLSKRLSDALKREGFEVNSSTQPAFALTTLEYDAPSAIVCSTNMREMGALDIARMIRADAKNSAMPIIALGDGSQRALMEAFQAGCDDYIDRTRPPAVIATHIKNIIISKAEGFQPTQMLAQADTSLSGSLTHHDLPGVMQMLGHAHQTGALHINSGDTDALLFFDAGAITHAEFGSLFGDEAVIHILKSCFKNNSGIYKFVYGSSPTQRTVLRSATDLMLDAMREVDESSRDDWDSGLVGVNSMLDQNAVAGVKVSSAAKTPEDDATIASSNDPSTTTLSHHSAPIVLTGDDVALEPALSSPSPEPSFAGSNSPPLEEEVAGEYTDDSVAIESLLDRYAATSAFREPEFATSDEQGVDLLTHSNDYSAAERPQDHPAPTYSYETSTAAPSFDCSLDMPSESGSPIANSDELSHFSPLPEESAVAPADDCAARTPTVDCSAVTHTDEGQAVTPEKELQ
jgi:CheY-like chemotaxis protein